MTTILGGIVAHERPAFDAAFLPGVATAVQSAHGPAFRLLETVRKGIYRASFQPRCIHQVFPALWSKRP